MPPDNRLRWFAVCVLVSSSALNYLDRMVLSSLAPTIKAEFGLSGEDIGYVFAAFSIVYAFSAPLVGMWIDRVGLRRGAALIVGLWSLAGIATGFAGTFAGLLYCRGFLGFAEAGGVPATGKGFAIYLKPKERALGAALNQVGLTVGSMLAPILTESLARQYGWRSAFVIAGLLGFVWIPFWLAVSKRATALPGQTQSGTLRIREMLRDRRFLVLIIANSLAMAVYSLWTQWTTLFLVSAYGMTQAEANLRFVWIPPVFATLGGMAGGWMAMRLIGKGAAVLSARIRISLIASLFVGATAFAPILGRPEMAIAAISLSLAATTALSVNYYAIPLDLFGPGHAAFAVSALTGMFGLMQAFLSPRIGLWSDTVGWQPVCLGVAVLPFLSVLLLRMVLRTS